MKKEEIKEVGVIESEKLSEQGCQMAVQSGTAMYALKASAVLKWMTVEYAQFF